MRKGLLFLLWTFISTSFVSTVNARDFSYTFQGTTLYYTVLDEDAKTCMTRGGYNTTSSSSSGWVTTFNPGNNVSGNVIIPDEAYDGTDFYKVVKIGNSSFYFNKELTSVSIPGSVAFIGEEAFRTCSKLTEIIFQEPESDDTQPHTGTYTTTYADCKTSGTLAQPKECELYVLPGSVLTFSYETNQYYESQTTYSTFTIKLGDKVVVSTKKSSKATYEYTFDTAGPVILSISLYARFDSDSGRIYNIKLTSPWSAENGEIFITNNAFVGTPLENMSSGRNFPNAPTPFKSMTSLKTLTFTEKVTSVGDNSFHGCEGLTDVKCLSKVPPVASDETFSAPIYRYATLNIPANTITEYAESPGWKNFLITNEDKILPSSLALSPQALSLNVGQTAQLTAVIEPNNVTDKTILWSSSANDIATVQNGLVTGISAGQTTVTATIGDLVASCVVNVTSANPGESGGSGPLGWEEGDENASIRERLYMIPDEENNLSQMLGELKAASWISSNEDIAEVTRRGIVYTYEFGESIVRAKDVSGTTIAIFEIFVCPTVTVQHGEGVLYSHHVLYNSRPQLNLNPGKGYCLAGVTHDGEAIDEVLVQNDGKYVPLQPITANSIINLSLEHNSSNEPTTGVSSIWSDSNVRVYVNGHNIKIFGVRPGVNVSLTNLSGVQLLYGKYYDINVIDPGIYLLSIEGEHHTYKVLTE